MKKIYVGTRFRMLVILGVKKMFYNTQSYCSFREYFKTLKSDRVYKLIDDGFVIFINRVK